MKNAGHRGLTWIEVLVALAICGLVVFFALPKVTTVFGEGSQHLKTLSNMKQLHMATEAMVVDGVLKPELPP